jgi:hypothetical protein
MFSIWFTGNATAALPIDSIGCLTAARCASAVPSSGPVPR